MTHWEHKEVFVLFLNDAVMSGKTGCSLSKTNDNNVRRIGEFLSWGNQFDARS